MSKKIAPDAALTKAESLIQRRVNLLRALGKQDATAKRYFSDNLSEYLQPLVKKGIELERAYIEEKRKLEEKATKKTKPKDQQLIETEIRARASAREVEKRSLRLAAQYSTLVLLLGEISPDFLTILELADKKLKVVAPKLSTDFQTKFLTGIEGENHRIGDASEQDLMLSVAMKMLSEEFLKRQNSEELIMLLGAAADEMGTALDPIMGSSDSRPGLPSFAFDINTLRINLLIKDIKSQQLLPDEKYRKTKELVSLIGPRHEPTASIPRYKTVLEVFMLEAVKNGDIKFFLEIREYLGISYERYEVLEAIIQNLDADFLEKLGTSPSSTSKTETTIFQDMSPDTFEHMLENAIARTPENEEETKKRAKIIELLLNQHDANRLKNPHVTRNLRETILMKAAEREDMGALRLLAKARGLHYDIGYNYDTTYPYPKTNLLNLLLEKRPEVKIEVLQTLVRNFPELLEVKEDEYSAVEIAILRGRLDFIEVLEKEKKEINPRPILLLQAATQSNHEACALLLKRFPQFAKESFSRPERFLIAQVFDYRKLYVPANAQLTALEIAAFNLFRNNAEAIATFTTLAAQGGEIKAKAEGDINPLQYIISLGRNRTEVIRPLCKHAPKMALEADIHGHNSLYHAINRVDLEALNIMMEGLTDEEILSVPLGSYGLDQSNILHFITANYSEKGAMECIGTCVKRFPHLFFAKNNKGHSPLNILLHNLLGEHALTTILQNTPLELFLSAEDNILTTALNLVKEVNYYRNSSSCAITVVDFFRKNHPAEYIKLVTRRDISGKSYIDEAFANGELGFINECEEYGLDLSKIERNAAGENALHIALTSIRSVTAMRPERRELVDYLVRKYPALLDEPDNKGLTPRHYALCAAIANRDPSLLEKIPPKTQGVAAFSGEAPIDIMGIRGNPGENIAQLVAKKIREDESNILILAQILKENPALAIPKAGQTSLLEILATSHSQNYSEKFKEVLLLCCNATTLTLEQQQNLILTSIKAEKYTQTQVFLQQYPSAVSIETLRKLMEKGRGYYYAQRELLNSIVMTIVEGDKDGKMMKDIILSEDQELLRFYVEKSSDKILRATGDQNPLVFALKNTKFNLAYQLVHISSAFIANIDDKSLDEVMPILLNQDSFLAFFTSKLRPETQLRLTGKRNLLLTALQNSDFEKAKLIAEQCPFFVENLSSEELENILPALARGNHDELLLTLIKHKPDVKLSNDINPLLRAVQEDRMEQAELLLRSHHFLIKDFDEETLSKTMDLAKGDLKLLLMIIATKPDMDLSGRNNPLIHLLQNSKAEEFEACLTKHPEFLTKLHPDSLTEVLKLTLTNLPTFKSRPLLRLILQKADSEIVAQTLVSEAGNSFLQLMIDKEMLDLLLDLQQYITTPDQAQKFQKIISENLNKICDKLSETADSYKCLLSTDFIIDPVLLKTDTGSRYYCAATPHYAIPIMGKGANPLMEDPIDRKRIRSRISSQEVKDLFFKKFSAYQQTLLATLTLATENVVEAKALAKLTEVAEEVKTHLQRGNSSDEEKALADTFTAKIEAAKKGPQKKPVVTTQPAENASAASDSKGADVSSHTGTPRTAARNRKLRDGAAVTDPLQGTVRIRT